MLFRSGIALQITATELKLNIGKYLSMAAERDIFITKNGRRVAKLTNSTSDRTALLDSLVGIARTDDPISLDDIKEERLINK